MTRDIQLTPLEAYDVAIAFLTAYWERGLKRSDDIANLLSSMNRGKWGDGSSADPAQLQDWMNAVARVKNSTISAESTTSHA